MLHCNRIATAYGTQRAAMRLSAGGVAAPRVANRGMSIEVSVEPFELPSLGRWRRRPAGTAGQRLIAIGDVHGRWDLLAHLLKAIEAQIESSPALPSRLILLGDLVDRGPNSRRVAEFLRDVQRNSTRVAVLLGNHEQALLDSIEGNPHAQAMWLEHGGLETLASYGVAPPGEDEDCADFGARVARALGADTIDWLRDLPLSLHIGDYFFCHAGIRPGRALARQAGSDLLWIRDAFLDSDRRHPAIIVHGHSISEEVEIRHNRIGLDTGAYRTGILSAAILTDESTCIISARGAPDPA